jgi:hydrogenase nickel incorporation protein HypA/HybF
MHEASLMQRVLEEAECQARAHGCTVIHLIRLRVGALSGAVPEALEFAFEALKAGTAAATGRLEIERVPARARCRACGHEFELDEPALPCPACAAWDTVLIQGRELELARLTAG